MTRESDNPRERAERATEAVFTRFNREAEELRRIVFGKKLNETIDGMASGRFPVETDRVSDLIDALRVQKQRNAEMLREVAVAGDHAALDLGMTDPGNTLRIAKLHLQSDEGDAEPVVAAAFFVDRDTVPEQCLKLHKPGDLLGDPILVGSPELAVVELAIHSALGAPRVWERTMRESRALYPGEMPPNDV